MRSSDETELDKFEPDVTVVIPAYKGITTIKACIESLLVASQGRRTEILVVESSQDGTVELVRKVFPTVRVIACEEQVTAGGARNIGAREARGRTILFVDQDCVVPEDWIERLTQHLSKTEVGIVGGAIGFRNWFNYSGSAVYFLEFLYHFPSRKNTTFNRNFLLGCNLCCRREVFEKVQFPERTLAEDVLFSSRVQEAGWQVAYDPSIVVLHWNRSGWDEFFRYNAKMGRASAQYHQVLKSKEFEWVLKFPWLIFLSPLKILPKIGFSLIGQWRYFLRFLLLAPMCLLGNWAWGWAFWKEVRAAQKTS
jgi:GT2 family glycosyltransferase